MVTATSWMPLSEPAFMPTIRPAGGSSSAQREVAFRGLRSALRAAGDEVLREHPLINALTANVPMGRLQALAHVPWVESISLDAVVQANQSASPDATLRATLGLPVQSPAGNHVGVAIIDSGIEAGPEFDNRIDGFFDFTQGGMSSRAHRRVRTWNARRGTDRWQWRP